MKPRGQFKTRTPAATDRAEVVGICPSRYAGDRPCSSLARPRITLRAEMARKRLTSAHPSSGVDQKKSGQDRCGWPCGKPHAHSHFPYSPDGSTGLLCEAAGYRRP